MWRISSRDDEKPQRKWADRIRKDKTDNIWKKGKWDPGTMERIGKEKEEKAWERELGGKWGANSENECE